MVIFFITWRYLYKHPLKYSRVSSQIIENQPVLSVSIELPVDDCRIVNLFYLSLEIYLVFLRGFIPIGSSVVSNMNGVVCCPIY